MRGRERGGEGGRVREENERHEGVGAGMEGRWKGEDKEGDGDKEG